MAPTPLSRSAGGVNTGRILQHYGGEFTIRCSRPSGRETEMEKLLNGWGDYIFYGFSDPEAVGLAAWFLGDLTVFRRWIEWYPKQFGVWPGELKSNHDGSSSFVSFEIDDVFPEFVVARSETLNNR